MIDLRPSHLHRAMALAMPALSLLCSQALAQDAAVSTLPTVTVRADQDALPGATPVDPASLQSQRAATSDTARLLQDTPGVSLNGAGGVSSLPSMHGLADDRLRIQVDGMDLIASCPNHMNPPLSYLDPTNVGSLRVYSGIAPVSPNAFGDFVSTPGTPQVDAVHTFAVVRQTLTRYQRALALAGSRLDKDECARFLDRCYSLMPVDGASFELTKRGVRASARVPPTHVPV